MLLSRCEKTSDHEKRLIFSVCDFPGEFTCMSGACVDIYKRCDKVKDCDDGSDELECSLLKIPTYYDRFVAPKYCKQSNECIKSNEIHIQVKIINFDFINTLSNEVGLTLEVKFQWVDPDIDFEDAKNSEEEIHEFKIVSDSEMGKIWLPLLDITYDNAVIGETIKEEFYSLGVIIKSNASARNANTPKESLIYPGAKNPLVVTQKMKMKYRCDFFVQNFPFDKEACRFIISLSKNGNNTIVLTQDNDSVAYDGPLILNEFEIKRINSTTNHLETKTSFVFTVEFQRLYKQHLLSTFLQSFLLWFLSYLTLFINIPDFSNRFMGAVTSLLVLTALLGSMQASLPKTAYFKVIDIWFNWFMSNIFLIILIHVIVDHLHKNVRSVLPGPIPFPRENKDDKSVFLNQTFKIVVFITNFFFIIFYFAFGLL